MEAARRREPNNASLLATKSKNRHNIFFGRGSYAIQTINEFVQAQRVPMHNVGTCYAQETDNLKFALVYLTL